MGRGKRGGEGVGLLGPEYLEKQHTELCPVIYSVVLTKLTKTYNLNQNYQ